MDLIAHQSWPTNDGVAGWMCYAMLYWIMDAFEVDNLPADLAAELESRFFWWEPVGLGPRSLARILAQAMNLASFNDVRRLERTLVLLGWPRRCSRPSRDGSASGLGSSGAGVWRSLPAGRCLMRLLGERSMPDSFGPKDRNPAQGSATALAASYSRSTIIVRVVRWHRGSASPWPLQFRRFRFFQNRAARQEGCRKRPSLSCAMPRRSYLPTVSPKKSQSDAFSGRSRFVRYIRSRRSSSKTVFNRSSRCTSRSDDPLCVP